MWIAVRIRLENELVALEQAVPLVPSITAVSQMMAGNNRIAENLYVSTDWYLHGVCDKLNPWRKTRLRFEALCGEPGSK